MKKLILGLIVLSGAPGATALAQNDISAPTMVPDVLPMITDRPDFTESPQAVPRGLIQVEAGVTFERSGRQKNMTIGETLVRVAADERAEVRIGIPSYLNLRGDGAKADGFDNASLGAKFALIRRENFPISILVNATLPTGSRKVAAREFSAEAVVATETSLSEKVGLAFNVGYGRPNEGNGRFDQIFGSASLGFDISERVGAYAEVYAFNRDERGGKSKQFVNSGFTYAVNPNLQLDARLGFGLGNDVNGPDYFTGVGVSQRF